MGERHLPLRLATQDGAIVTAPVFISVYPPLCWEYSSFDATELSMLALQRPQTNAQGNPIGRYGFAALDGSWYTGLEYCVIVATTPLGVLAVELEGGISLISPDGTQTHLWDPDQVPLPGYAYSEEYDTAWWDSEGQTCDGPWLRCLSGYDDQGQLVYSYINVQTGEVTGAVPDGYFQERDETGRGYT